MPRKPISMRVAGQCILENFTCIEYIEVMFVSAQTQLSPSHILGCTLNVLFRFYILLIKEIPMKKHTNFKTNLLVIALALGAVSAPVFAADSTLTDGNESTYVTSFKALDVNSDGTLSKSEAGKEKLFAKHFAAADKDTDGTLDQEEYTNYKSQADQKNMKRVGSDSMITSKVKGNLLKEEGLKSMKVHVKTHQGVVLLSGFVDTEAQIQQAGEIAAKVEGVKTVKNSLLVKKE
jgi:hyperosmotically inducible periplasmic protein